MRALCVRPEVVGFAFSLLALEVPLQRASFVSSLRLPEERASL